MCLDIDPDSVIHKHIVKKIKNESWSSYTNAKQIEKWRLRSPYSKNEDAYHSFTMLPRFHISLGAPRASDPVPNSITLPTDKFYARAIIGDMTLAPIYISEKNGKKSAWIPLYIEMVEFLVPHYYNLRKIFDNPDDQNLSDNKILHISLANLTGKPRDSIAHPEDCIIDTITA